MDPYLHEWLDYHLSAMNIQNIYLYDNSEHNYLKNWYDNTRNHPVYKRVEVFHWYAYTNIGIIELGPQEQAYTDCLVRFGKNTPITQWERKHITQVGTRLGFQRSIIYRELDVMEGHEYLALIDGDEFLVPKGNYTNVHDVVKDYLEPYGGALTVNWMLFGSSNKTFYNPIPVTKRFQYREEVPNGVVKTIVKASDFKAVRNPHAVSLSDGKLVRTTLHKGAVQKEQSSNHSSTGASDSMLPSEALLLYHYRYLSDREYNEKNCGRGHLSSKKCNKETMKAFTLDELRRNGKPEHIASRPGTVLDESAWKLLSTRVPKYRGYDDGAWEDYS
mmetsp:Transcript_19688/g.42792  ORF Transcript_19688/g.42792 Transcript_19688/m.42792 type:complete len:331 (+) Transcript_19688:395-1387(+)